MNSAVLLFLARILLLILLYLFLYVVVQALRQDLRVAARGAAPQPSSPRPAKTKAGSKAPRSLGLELVEAGQTALPPGELFPLHDPFVIGRGAQSDVTLDDDWISATHLRLRRANGSWLAEDLGSTNGTRVNGRLLTGAVPVRPGDLLDLGRVKLKLVDVP